MLGFGVSLGRILADSWFVLLTYGSDGLPNSWGFVMSWMRVSLVNDCSDANQDKDGACGVHCFGVIAIGEL